MLTRLRREAADFSQDSSEDWRRMCVTQMISAEFGHDAKAEDEVYGILCRLIWPETGDGDLCCWEESVSEEVMARTWNHAMEIFCGRR